MAREQKPLPSLRAPARRRPRTCGRARTGRRRSALERPTGCPSASAVEASASALLGRPLAGAPDLPPDDPDPKPRAWLERTGGVANVAVPLADALACALPQGIA
ncbi:MAG TPA: hypothetical protein VIK91_24810, partial [Nannocystis sp.]